MTSLGSIVSQSENESQPDDWRESEIGMEFWFHAYFGDAQENFSLSPDAIKEFGEKLQKHFSEFLREFCDNNSLKKKNLSEEVEFVSIKNYLKFPDLVPENPEDCMFNYLRFTINPCCGNSSTKLSIDYFHPDGNMDKRAVREFFRFSEENCDKLWKEIAKSYFKFIKEYDGDQQDSIKRSIAEDNYENVNFFKVLGYILGERSPAYQKLVENSKKLQNIETLRSSDREIDKIFESLSLIAKWPFSDYEWFIEEKNDPKLGQLMGLFGYYEGEKVGRLFGFTHGYPHITASDVIIDLLQKT